MENFIKKTSVQKENLIERIEAMKTIINLDFSKFEGKKITKRLETFILKADFSETISVKLVDEKNYLYIASSNRSYNYTRTRRDGSVNNSTSYIESSSHHIRIDNWKRNEGIFKKEDLVNSLESFILSFKNSISNIDKANKNIKKDMEEITAIKKEYEEKMKNYTLLTHELHNNKHGKVRNY